MKAQNRTIRPLQEADVPDVRALIETGLAEHWGVYDASRNPDLNNLMDAYAGADFLVARNNGRIVGCGALVPAGDCTGQIVRMSVAREMRRQGVATAILQALITCARDRGLRRVVLETTETWSDARGFYEANGFRLTHCEGGDAYYILEL